MATWRSAETSSAGCLDLAEWVRTNRKSLAPNQKKISAKVRRRAVVSEVGATRRLLNFLSSASAAGDHGGGGNSKTASRPEFGTCDGTSSVGRVARLSGNVR